MKVIGTSVSQRALIILVFIVSVAACGCGGGPKQWAITISGNSANVINQTVYDSIANCNVTIKNANGIPLEDFLYLYSLYPVISVSVEGHTYDWATLASTAVTDIPVIVMSDGRIFDGKNYTRAENIDVTLADKPTHTSQEIEPSMLYSLGLAGNPGIIPDKSDRMVLFYVDALGYERYELAKSKGIINNITSLGEPARIACVYPSVSIVNSKTLVSGIRPNASRGDFQVDHPDGPTILEQASQQGLTAFWIDGKTSPVYLGDNLINRPDTNNDRYEADEVIDEAIGRYGNGTNLLFVHFKDTDSSAHMHGPYSDEAMAALQFVDQQIGRMLLYLGHGTTVIVYSDHGGHVTYGMGNHGTLIADDMIVPFVVHVV